MLNQKWRDVKFALQEVTVLKELLLESLVLLDTTAYKELQTQSYIQPRLELKF